MKWWDKRKAARALKGAYVVETHEVTKVTSWEKEGKRIGFRSVREDFQYFLVRKADEEVIVECRKSDTRPLPLRSAKTLSEARRLGFGIVPEGWR